MPSVVNHWADGGGWWQAYHFSNVVSFIACSNGVDPDSTFLDSRCVRMLQESTDVGSRFCFFARCHGIFEIVRHTVSNKTPSLVEHFL